jgi:hypothetical protein
VTQVKSIQVSVNQIIKQPALHLGYLFKKAPDIEVIPAQVQELVICISSYKRPGEALIVSRGKGVAPRRGALSVGHQSSAESDRQL